MKQGVTKMGNRISAWLLTLVMIIGLAAVPAGEVKAESVTGKDATDSSKPVYVEFVLDKENSTNTYNQYAVNLHNNSGSTICDWIIKVQFTEDPGWNAGWNGAKDGYDSSTKVLTIRTYDGGSWDNATIYNGDIGSGAGFQVRAGALDNATVTITYSTGESTEGPATGEDTPKTDGSDFGTTRDYSTGVTATLANQDPPTNDWSGFDVTINNNSGTTICDWIIVLQVPSGTASAFKCWNATFAADGDTIYLYPMQSGANAVISPGTLVNDAPGGGFGGKYVNAPTDIQVKAVYYNKGTSSSYDYSSGETNDNTGGGGGNGGSSSVDTSTNKDLDVEYNYAKLLQESLYFYDANMCGYLEDDCAISWRKNCHTYDKNVTYSANNKTYSVNASGGFHDAGDHVKFGLPQGYAATMLGMSYYEFEDAYTELGQKEHLKTITDYFCDYFRRCTVYESGSVIAFCYQVGEGNSDHSIWSAPEGQTLNRPAYFADASHPATDQVSVAIAALAMNYKNFGNADDLKTAEDLFAFVKRNSKSCATNGCAVFYDSTSWQDDYALAASALWIATGNSSYKTEYDNNKSGINQYWVLDWANSGGMASMLAGDSATLGSITDVCKNKPVIDRVFNCVSNWGSCRYSAAEQFTGLVYDKLTGSKKYTDWATSQMNYMIGDNPNKRCYIVGYNENSSKYPHHRAASRSNGAGSINENHYTLLGALVGGPGSDGTYKDDQADYYCNEVALDYNAGLVGAAAGLYHVHKNDTTAKLSYAGKTTDNYSIQLASEAELKKLGVTKYYGGASAAVPVTGVSLGTDTKVALVAGDTKEITVTVEPSNATNKNVTWSSSDSSVATVKATSKSKAVISALKSGTATLTVTTEDGGKAATCTVTVTNPVTAFALDKTATTIVKGQKEKLTYKVTPTNPDAYTVSWNSNQPSIVSVDAATGEVTAVSKGTAVITATLTRTADRTTLTSQCTVTVTVPLERINLNQTTLKLDKSKGESGILTASAYPDGAELGTVKWSSSNTKVATVDQTGKVTPVACGETTITATATNNSSITASCTVTVIASVTGVSVTPTTLQLEKGAVGQLTAAVSPSDAQNKTVTWSSNNTGIAQVDSNGKVTAGQTIGTAVITATTTDGSKAASCTVNVVGVKVTGVRLTKNTSGLSLVIGDTRNLAEEFAPEVQPGNADEQRVTWTSASPNIVRVDNNTTITALKEGTAKLTVTAGGGQYSQTCTITVNKKTQAVPVVSMQTMIRTKNSLTIKGNVTSNGGQNSNTLEYLINGSVRATGSPGANVTISGLAAFTPYTVSVRWAGNDTYAPSAVAANQHTEYTLVADPYTIDVSKLDNPNYVEALYTEYNVNGTQHKTVDYNTASKELTLTDDTTKYAKGYTITGNNPNVTIKTGYGNYKITLQNATVKKVDLSSAVKADLVITGNVNVKDEIFSSTATDVTISGTGTLTTKDIDISNGTLDIQGGTINAGVPETGKPGISAEQVTITDATVNAEGGNGAAGIQGEDVTITDSTVNAKGGNGEPGISGSNSVTITDSTVTAEGGSGASAIEGGDVVLEDSNLKVESDAEKGAIASGDGEDQDIVIKGDTEVTSDTCKDNLYSEPPVDENGKPVTRISIIFLDTDETELDSKEVSAGTTIKLPSIDQEQGYQMTWKNRRTEKSYKAGESVKVTENTVFIVVATKILVTRITLDSTKETIEVGDGVALAETVEPSNAYDDSVTWSSNNTKVATVDQDGEVTGEAPGTAVITVKANDGSGKYATCTVTVVEGDPEEVEVEKIKITGDTKKVAPGKKLKLTATVYPEDATNQKVVWKVSNTKYAFVNSKGVVTTKKAGKGKSVTVTAVSDEDSTIKATYKISIMKKAVTKIKLSASKKVLKKGKSVTVKAKFTPSAGISKELTWTSSNPNVATVSSKGKVKAKKKGKVKITAKAKDGSGKKATITIKVK